MFAVLHKHCCFLKNEALNVCIALIVNETVIDCVVLFQEVACSLAKAKHG